jgi:NAD(P)-dependent dehydrogenase (short-subunit alcohol dehydrogenase family)
MIKLDFTGKTIVITGATRGIGKQIADDLASLGADLIITGTDQSEIDGLNALQQAGTRRKLYCRLDLSENESVENFISEMSKEKVIHGLVNNAGINRLNPIQDAQLEDWHDMIAVNLTAPFRLINALSKRMIAQNYGRILNIGSIFSKISKEKRSIYSATKFGVDGLTTGISNDLARFNIFCNTLSPGFVLTDLTRNNLSEKEMLDLSDMVPAKRLAQVADISNVAVFLLSDLNQYLTGQNIIVDGGYTNV